MGDVDPVAEVVRVVVEDGWTVHDVADPARRAQVVGVAGVGPLSESSWAQVRHRLVIASQRAAGVRESCRSCGAPIRWARTERAEQLMPLDPLPHVAGNVVLEVPAGRAQRRARVLSSSDEWTPWPRYRPHWATCPNALAHRRARKATASTPAPAEVDDGSQRVIVRMRVESATEEHVSRLRDVLESWPGSTPVELVLIHDGREVPMLVRPESYSVAPCRELATDLRQLLGRDAVTMPALAAAGGGRR